MNIEKPLDRLFIWRARSSIQTPTPPEEPVLGALQSPMTLTDAQKSCRPSDGEIFYVLKKATVVIENWRPTWLR
ncbi:hypothetical protein [Rhizobium sp. BK251]|uniref:hypothetical protein n=1 Tax=Rhizobium sp. BK251 TaxID=2512125 RepID=UPI00104E1279|nr:hypothetical protein [Rhizobium sp. BK251]TCL66398.1 hypothetical protein EV286_111109 [Rhizobium sp. BK251]